MPFGMHVAVDRGVTGRGSERLVPRVIPRGINQEKPFMRIIQTGKPFPGSVPPIDGAFIRHRSNRAPVSAAPVLVPFSSGECSIKFRVQTIFSA